MLNWKVGILTGWSVSTGKSSKYLYQWISEEEWQMFMATYFDGNVDNAWKSIFCMCELFRNVGQFVGEKLGWKYNEKEGKAAKDFLEYVHQLPQHR